MKKLASTPLNMFLSLTLICLVVSGILAGIQYLTAGPIAQAEKESQEAAIRAVLPSFETLREDEVNGWKRYQAFDRSNHLTGTAIQAIGQGFGGEFTVMVGFRPDGALIRYQVLKHQETPGLGAKMDNFFQASIAGTHPSQKPLVVSKDGGQVNAITAATISSRAFLKTINEAASMVAGTTTNATTSATSHHPSN